MTKEELIQKIRRSFKNVKLEDGVGFWEGQGLDYYADAKTMAELRKKDERDNWDNIPYKDMNDCYSSLSFFDAKGMRFCLPKLLICNILADQLREEYGESPPNVLFTLCHELDDDYNKKRFFLFDNHQILSVIYYLEYRLDEMINSSDINYGYYEYSELEEAINGWKQKLPPM